MEIPAWWFISFWAIISITFLHLGFHALDKTELSHSVSPVVMFLFKHSLAVSSCFSSSYALKFRAQSTYSVRSAYVLLVYVFFSFISPGTIQGIFIWHVLKAIFVCILSKLKNFLGMIYMGLSGEIPLRIIFIVVTTLIHQLPFSYSFILSIIYSGTKVKLLGGILFEIMIMFVLAWIVWVSIDQQVDFKYVNYPAVFNFYLGPILALLFYLVLVCKEKFNEVKTRSGILLMLEISLIFASATKRDFYPILALSISHWICVSWAALPRVGDDGIVSGDPFSDGLFRIAARFIVVRKEEMLSRLNEHKVKKFIEFVVGTMGAVLFQNFFRITSFTEIAAFLYFVVVWLANLVLLGFCGDFGVFNFLLANVVVGCTVGQFGLHSATWAAFGAALLLYALRLKLESFSIAYGEGQRIRLHYSEDPPRPQPHRLHV